MGYTVKQKHPDGSERLLRFDTLEQALRDPEVKKSDPITADTTAFPRVVYNVDRSTRVCENQKQYDALMLENKGGKRVWGDGPADFGIETHPPAPDRAEYAGRW